MRIGFRYRRRGMLDPILTAKRAEVARMLAGPRHLAVSEPGGGVLEALARPSGDPFRWIAHVSIRRRPRDDERASEGEDADEASSPPPPSEESPSARAIRAAKNGAAAVWIPTDELFTGGSYAHLRRCRDALDAAFGDRRPRIIGEDVLVAPVQLDRAAGAGADAVLLIAKALAPSSLSALVEAARRLGLEPIVEAASDAEIERAVLAGARVIAATARDRDTGKIDAERPRVVLSRGPPRRRRALPGHSIRRRRGRARNHPCGRGNRG